MEPTLRQGDWALAVGVRRPRPGMVAVIEHPERPGFEMVKRLISARDDGWWVEGDAAGASTDSRHFGVVDRDAVVGRVVVVYWPVRRARLVR